jgi:hypothetical protein
LLHRARLRLLLPLYTRLRQRVRSGLLLPVRSWLRRGECALAPVRVRVRARVVESGRWALPAVTQSSRWALPAVGQHRRLR